MEDVKIASILNDLVETSLDGVAGFKTCAEGAKDASLRAYFQTRVQNCEEAVRALNIEVLRHGGKPIEHGSATGALRRAWINIRTAVTSNDDLAILEECEGAEDAALQAYSKALQENLPVHVRTLLEMQKEGAKENHNRVRPSAGAIRTDVVANPTRSVRHAIRTIAPSGITLGDLEDGATLGQVTTSL